MRITIMSRLYVYVSLYSMKDFIIWTLSLLMPRQRTKVFLMTALMHLEIQYIKPQTMEESKLNEYKLSFVLQDCDSLTSPRSHINCWGVEK